HGMVAAAEDSGLLDEDETLLLEGALEFEHITAADVLRPIAEVDSIEEDWATGDVQQLCVRTGHSRVPVRRAGAYVGYVHVHATLGDALSQPLRRDRIRELGIVPAEPPLDDVLEAMQRARAHLAVVDDREPGEPAP